MPFPEAFNFHNREMVFRPFRSCLVSVLCELPEYPVFLRFFPHPPLCHGLKGYSFVAESILSRCLPYFHPELPACHRTLSFTACLLRPPPHVLSLVLDGMFVCLFPYRMSPKKMPIPLCLLSQRPRVFFFVPPLFCRVWCVGRFVSFCSLFFFWCFFFFFWR